MDIPLLDLVCMEWRLTGTIGKIEGSLDEEEFGAEAGSGGEEGAKGGDKEGLIGVVEGGFKEVSLQLGEVGAWEVTMWKNWARDEVSGGVAVVTDYGAGPKVEGWWRECK